MVANKSQAFITFTLNANVNENELYVAVLLIVDLTLLWRQMYGINMVVHGKQAFISLPNVTIKSVLHYPSRDAQQSKTATQIQRQNCL